jgi:hypothetical protein
MSYLNYMDDISQLIGFQVQSLSITPNSVDINFSYGTEADGRSTSIDIEAGFEFVQGSEHEIAWQANDPSAFRETSACLIKLIGCSVISARILENNELELDFSKDSKLRLLIDPRGFDSYTVFGIAKMNGIE